MTLSDEETWSPEEFLDETNTNGYGLIEFYWKSTPEQTRHLTNETVHHIKNLDNMTTNN
jgi:hypothetical protein